MTLNVCVVGYGLMGKTHTEMYVKHPEVKHVTVVDIKPEMLPQGDPYEKPVYFTTTLSNSDRFDLVSICTPTYLHLQSFYDVADKTRVVLVEKPLTLSVEESRLMEQLAAQRGISVKCAFVDRFNPTILNLKSLMAEREVLARYEFTRIRPLPKTSWYANKNLSGGPLLDLGIHDIDLSRWITSAEVETISASLSDMIYRINFSMSNGDFVKINTGWINDPDHFETSIFVKSENLDCFIDENTLEKKRYPKVYQEEIFAFIAEVLNGTATQLASLDDAIKAMELCEEIESRLV